MHLWITLYKRGGAAFSFHSQCRQIFCTQNQHQVYTNVNTSSRHTIPMTLIHEASTCSIAASYSRVNRKGIRSSRNWSKIARWNKGMSRLRSNTFHPAILSFNIANFVFSANLLRDFCNVDSVSVNFRRETKFLFTKKFSKFFFDAYFIPCRYFVFFMQKMKFRKANIWGKEIFFYVIEKQNMFLYGFDMWMYQKIRIMKEWLIVSLLIFLSFFMKFRKSKSMSILNKIFFL